MALNPNKFNQSATIALDDIKLRNAVRKSTTTVTERRAYAMNEVEMESLRQQARAAKLRALHDLPELLEQMERNVIAAGGHVLWAEDGDEANRHVINICKQFGVKSGVKSKSMVTEEIELVPALEKAGIDMIETDLGEFIVQISGDHPSHIVMPLMHRSKEEVRDIFIETLDMPYTENVEDMTMFARHTLRQRYLDADVGMSGGNFLIAETGHLVTVTNEGNARLSTGLPKVHIAVVGIEKIVPTWEDFATLMQMLTRSGTGQRITVYINMFGGPAASDDPDGPDEFYLVLLDNGRTGIYASEYAEALACIRCGACLNACPVYQAVGGHAYGSVYQGPIGSVITPLLKGKENAAPLPYASSLCGACKEACPVDINIPDMLLSLRNDLQGKQGAMWQASMKGYAASFSNPLLYQASGKVASAASRANTHAGGANRDKHLGTLPPPLNGWTDQRDFPPFAEESFHDWWRKNRS